MREILCVATQLQVVDALKKYFEDSGYHFRHLTLPVSEDALKGDSNVVVVLMSPVACNNKYISAENTWKEYLREHLPDALFVVAGFSNFEQDNYLDLLSLPNDVTAFLNRAETAGNLWNPVFTGGLDMSVMLARFFEGHGDESVTDELNGILRILKIAGDELKHDDVDYQEVHRELLLANRLPERWNTLGNRWINYFPNFQCLPFFGVFERVNATFQHIAPYFHGNCEEETLFCELDCIGNLENAKADLVKIEQLYVK